MNINWKVRLRSGPFWAGALGSFLLFLYGVCGLLGIEPPVEKDEVLGAGLLFLSFLAAVGIVNDPTTPGMEDSERAMGYDTPGGTKQ